MSDEILITSKPMPEWSLKAGQSFDFDTSAYFEATDDENFIFEQEDLPDYFSLDLNTGKISGIAPHLVADEIHLISIKATHLGSRQSAVEYFPLRIEGETPLFGEDSSITDIGIPPPDKNYEDSSYRWQIVKYIEYIISQHFPVVYIYDAFSQNQDFYGKFIEKRTSKSDFSIFTFENCLIITSGEKAYEDGNTARLLKTLKEVYLNDLPEQNWSRNSAGDLQGVGLSSTDLLTLNKAWVVARLFDLPVSEEAPSDQALASYNNLKREVGNIPALRLVL